MSANSLLGNISRAKQITEEMAKEASKMAKEALHRELSKAQERYLSARNPEEMKFLRMLEIIRNLFFSGRHTLDETIQNFGKFCRKLNHQDIFEPSDDFISSVAWFSDELKQAQEEEIRRKEDEELKSFIDGSDSDVDSDVDSELEEFCRDN